MTVVAIVAGRDDDVSDQPADLRDAEGYEVLLVVRAAPCPQDSVDAGPGPGRGAGPARRHRPAAGPAQHLCRVRNDPAAPTAGDRDGDRVRAATSAPPTASGTAEQFSPPPTTDADSSGWTVGHRDTAITMPELDGICQGASMDFEPRQAHGTPTTPVSSRPATTSRPRTPASPATQPPSSSHRSRGGAPPQKAPAPDQCLDQASRQALGDSVTLRAWSTSAPPTAWSHKQPPSPGSSRRETRHRPPGAHRRRNPVDPKRPLTPSPAPCDARRWPTSGYTERVSPTAPTAR